MTSYLRSRSKNQLQSSEESADGARPDPLVHLVNSQELFKMTESFKNCVIVANQELSHSLAAPLNAVRDMLVNAVNETTTWMKGRGFHLQFQLLYLFWNFKF